MVENEGLKLPNRFPKTQMHEYLMPNHFHAMLEMPDHSRGIIEIVVRATLVVALLVTLVVAGATKRVGNHKGCPHVILLTERTLSTDNVCFFKI